MYTVGLYRGYRIYIDNIYVQNFFSISIFLSTVYMYSTYKMYTMYIYKIFRNTLGQHWQSVNTHPVHFFNLATQ